MIGRHVQLGHDVVWGIFVHDSGVGNLRCFSISTSKIKSQAYVIIVDSLDHVHNRQQRNQMPVDSSKQLFLLIAAQDSSSLHETGIIAGNTALVLAKQSILVATDEMHSLLSSIGDLSPHVPVDRSGG